MYPKDFNELPLQDRIGLLENNNKEVMGSVAEYEQYKSDLYLVNDMVINVLEHKEEKRIIQAIALENDDEDIMFSDSTHMG